MNEAGYWNNIDKKILSLIFDPESLDSESGVLDLDDLDDLESWNIRLGVLDALLWGTASRPLKTFTLILSRAIRVHRRIIVTTRLTG